MKYNRIFLELLILFTLSCTSSSGETVTEVSSTVTSVGSAKEEVVEVHTSPVVTVSEMSVVAEPDVVMYKDGREYLSGVVPPCSVDGDVNRDPCEPRALPVLDTSSDYASITFLEVDFLRVMLPEDDLDFIGTHLVLRGVVQDKSTRCDYYPIVFPNFVAGSMKEPRFEQLYDYHCFVDVAVSEYIVGEGPPVMTVSVNRYPITRYVIDELGKDPEEVSNYPRSWTAGAYEGKEMVVFLSTSITFAVETWAATDVWFVQRTDDLIQAVSLDRDVSPDYLKDQKIMPLQELVQRAKQAAEERNMLTNGRLGIDPRLPLLITDAYDLREYYENAGAVYGTVEGATVLPPPVPGEGDPAPPTIPTDEEGTVSSAPVPSEETTVPPPTDDAGLPDEEVTTTVVSTTTTTTEVNTTAVVPTSEVVSTVATAPIETTTTTTEPATTETASTTTTTVATGTPGGEGGLPEPEDGLPGEEQSAPATTLSGNNNIPEAENTTLPVGNQEEEQQDGRSDPGQEPGG